MASHWLLTATDETQPDERMAALVGAEPAAVVRAGRLALAVAGGAVAAADGRAACGFLGVVFDIAALAERLRGRGLAFAGRSQPDDVGRIVAEWSGHGGPEALGTARWQGAVACLHSGQRLAFVARDVLGAGSLWGVQVGRDWAFATAPECAAAALPGGVPFAVPPGLVVRLGDGEALARPIAVAPEHAPFYRKLPDGWPPASLAEVRAGLRERLAAALDAARRGLGPVVADPPTTAGERWLDALCPVPPDAAAPALWLRDGAETLAGALAEPDPAWEGPAAGPFARMESPEPCVGVEPAERRQRELRATWLVDGILAGAHARLRARGRVGCTPHLDPAVLAYVGALPPNLRAGLRADLERA